MTMFTWWMLATRHILERKRRIDLAILALFSKLNYACTIGSMASMEELLNNVDKM